MKSVAKGEVLKAAQMKRKAVKDLEKRYVYVPAPFFFKPTFRAGMPLAAGFSTWRSFCRRLTMHWAR